MAQPGCHDFTSHWCSKSNLCRHSQGFSNFSSRWWPRITTTICGSCPETPPKMLPLAAKKSAQAPQHQAELPTTSSKSAKWVQTQLAPVPAAPVHQAKAKQPGSQAPPQPASQGGYPASQASRQARKAMPIASPDVPRTPASASHAPQHSTPASSSHAKQPPHSPAKAPQSQPKAPQSQPKAPQTPPKQPAKAKRTPSGPSSWKQAQQPKYPPTPRATGWKNKLAFFTKYWIAQNYDVTTNAIVQFTNDLERAQTRMVGISTKAMNPSISKGLARQCLHPGPPLQPTELRQGRWDDSHMEGRYPLQPPCHQQWSHWPKPWQGLAPARLVDHGIVSPFPDASIQQVKRRACCLLPKAFWPPMCCPCFCNERSSCVLAHCNKSQVASHVVHVASTLAKASWPLGLPCPFHVFLNHYIAYFFIPYVVCLFMVPHVLCFSLNCIFHVSNIWIQ